MKFTRSASFYAQDPLLLTTFTSQSANETDFGIKNVTAFPSCIINELRPDLTSVEQRSRGTELSKKARQRTDVT